MQCKRIYLAIMGIGLLIYHNDHLTGPLAQSNQGSNEKSNNILTTRPNNSINLEITTHLGDNQTFRQGDVVSFLMSIDKDAYVLVIYQDASNNLYQIIPNLHLKNTIYKAGLFIQIPQQNVDFEFVIQPPFGTETLWAFASENSLPDLPGQALKNGLKKLNQSLKSIFELIRSRNIQDSKYYGEAQLHITTAGPPTEEIKTRAR